MSESEFIKKGVVERETEAQPVKTASDEVFEKVREIQKTFELEQNLGNLVFTNYPNYLSKVSLP